MPELRWVLLALGVLLVIGVYLWGRRSLRRNDVSRLHRRRWRHEPRISIDEEPEPVSRDVLFTRPGEEQESVALDGRMGEEEGWTLKDTGEAQAEVGRADSEEARFAHDVEGVARSSEPDAAPAAHPPERIVALRFVSKTNQFDSTEVVAALFDVGLEHGRYDIFHFPDRAHPAEAQFSVASLTEPGSFDLDRLDGKPIAGMSFFMVLPGVGDPVDRFDTMLEIARSLAYKLDAELLDDSGSSWSIQRERYIREELISYRLQWSPS